MRALLATVLVMSLAPSAGATTVTIGRQSLDTTGAFFGCPSSCELTVVQTALQNPGIVASPADGNVVGWRMYARRDSLDSWICPVVVHPQAGGKYTAGARLSATSTACGTGVPAATDGTLNQITTPLAVQAGDLIGADIHGGGSTVAIYTDTPLAAASAANFNPMLTTAEAPTGADPSDLMINFDVQYSTPTITQLSPASGDGGTQVTITGQHLLNATGVQFGTIAGSVLSNTNDTIVVVAPPGIQGTVDVTVTTVGGSATAPFAYPPPPGADTTAPVLSSLALSPKRFRAANIGGSVAVAVGGRVRYSVSEAGTVTFSVQRLVSGRKRGARCRAGARKGRRCTVVHQVKGSFERTPAAGQDTFRFTGRVGRKALKPGRYRLTGIAKDAAGNDSAPSRATFTVVK